jgi:hypothetical protein
MATTATRADAHTPRLFEHDLDPALFAGERLDELVRAAQKRDELGVQWADPGRQRYGNDPVYTTPRFPVLDDARARPVQYRIYGVAEWGPSEYRDAKERIIAEHAPDVDIAIVDSVVRVFAPHAVVALHGDPDLKLVCDVSGKTVWYVRPPGRMSTAEHENLLRGEFFLRWQESADELALAIEPGTGCFVPSRWAHWLDHPSDEPVVSFELGFWSRESVRARKVYDVNWLIRRLHLPVDPAGPGGRNDAHKHRLFDAISRATGKGARFRGI